MKFKLETTELMKPIIAAQPQASIKKQGIWERGVKENDKHCLRVWQGLTEESTLELDFKG